MIKHIIILILCIYIEESYSQCENDKRYNYYHDLIQKEKDTIQTHFDNIMDTYGDINKILETLLDKLSKTISTADSELDNLEKNNEEIKGINNKSNTEIKKLFNTLKTIEEELKLFDNSGSWLKELKDAEGSANKAIIHPTNDDLAQQLEKLEKLKKYLENLGDLDKYANDIMKIPHSVSDELNLLEKLVTENPDTSYFEKFHDDLKSLFIELTNLLDLNVFKEELDNIKAKASKNEDDANNVLSDTNKFLEKEKELQEIHYLANETIALAEEIEEIKEKINELSKNNEGIIDDKLKELQEEHETEIEKLNKKYNVKEGQKLLDELQRTKEQIENVNVADVQKEIDEYISDINYYTCILEKCEKNDESISDCKR